MKAGYRTESLVFNSSRFFYQFNFEALNLISEYGFDREQPKYKKHENVTGVWKIKQLKN